MWKGLIDNMNFEQKVLAYMKKHHMIKEGNKIVIGISGGADSVCLLFVLLGLREEYQLQIFGVHVNHGIRGEEAEEDQEFVRLLCEKHDIPLRVVKKEVPQLAREEKKSLEEVGREVRYEIFKEYAVEVGANYIAVAHHKNDQAETILHNLCRGSGLVGMVGIPIKRENIIRPLLCVSRKEIEEYLKTKGQPYQIDSTNLENEYTRNKWRNVILPLMEQKINTQVISHIANTAEHFRELQEYVEKNGKSAYERMVEIKEEALLLSLDSWEQEDVVIQKWVIRQMLFQLSGKLKNIEQVHVLDIMKLTQKQVGRQIDLPYSITVRKIYGKLRFFVDSEKKKRNMIIEDSEIIDNKLENDIDVTTHAKDTGKNKKPILAGELENKFEKSFILELERNMLKTFHIRLGDFQKEKLLPGEFIRIKFQVIHIEKFHSINGMNHLKIPKNYCTKCFDYDKMKRTVSFRKAMQDDYVQIDKDGHKKNLKKLFKDKKVPAEQRKDIWVLADDNHVFWIPGIRISEGYRIEESTKWVLMVSIE